MTLSIADQKVIRSTRRSDVELAVADLKTYLVASRWVSGTNRYATNAVKRLKADQKNSSVHQKDLAEYIAASSILHANDGWSYLGCAISALLQGDPHRALHLAYYAELRGALSLLAGEGLGVFNSLHYALKGGKLTQKLDHGQGTHLATWDILSFWSTEPSSGTLFSELVRPEGRTLEAWFLPHGGGAALASQAQHWFKAWGMDLSLAKLDQNARNEASYSPDGVGPAWSIPAADSLAFVASLWASLKPSPVSSFAELDRYILRLCLEGLFKGRTGRVALATDVDYQKLVDVTVKAQDYKGRSAELWRDFLLRLREPQDPLVFSASANPVDGTTGDVFGIIARAALLLRLATGSAKDLIDESGLAVDYLNFWTREIGVARGLWEPADPTPDLRDLWADVNVALSDIEDGSVPASVKELLSSFGSSLPVLTSYERITLWSLCTNDQ